MVSGALGKISRLCSPRVTYVMQIRVIFALPSPLFGAPLPWCPGQLPQSPTPAPATDYDLVCILTVLLSILF